MSDNAALDQNSRSSLLGVSSADGVSTVKVYADPITHRLLVDVSGEVSGNTLGQEVPAGTVNGVNTVFTVQNNPIFGEVSGQLMVSSVQNPANYGYVVSGTGPYTLTYVNAPTQAPDSFYNNLTGSSGNDIENEIVSGSGISWTLAHTPVTGTVALYGQGQRLYPTTDYSISGANITTFNSWTAGSLLADYMES